MKNKIQFKVVFGKEACSYADEHGTDKTIEAIKKDEIYGDYSIYELDSVADVEVIKSALNDAIGWEASWWDID